MPTLTAEELIQHVTIRMAATDRNPPILRGKAAPRDAWERDRLRREFAVWFVSECIESAGLTVVDERRQFTGSDMAGFRLQGTPPQMSAS